MKLGDREFHEVMSLPFYLGVANLAVKGFKPVDKFWANKDVDVSTTPEDVWDQGGSYTFSADGVADIDTISSDNTGDTDILVMVDARDIEGYEINGYAVLNWQNKVNIYANPELTGDALSFWRVCCMQNVSGEVVGTTAKDITGNVCCYVDTAIVLGVPTDITKIRAKIIGLNNQTESAIYTIPKGKRGFLIKGDVWITREQTSGGAVIFQYQSRRFGGVFKVKKSVWVITAGSSYFADDRTIPDIIPELTDIKISAEAVSSNDTSVFASFQILLIDKM